MKIGCLCVTENRDPIIEIALASFATQVAADVDAVLYVLDSSTPERTRACRNLCFSYPPNVYHIPWSQETGPRTVPKRLDAGCEFLFEGEKCDLVTIWDDDDWAPSDRLRLLAEAYQPSDKPWLAGYPGGHFVNLRTLWGHRVDCLDWPFWGGSLTFNRAAWKFRPFTGLPMPGYDRAFVSVIRMHFRSTPRVRLEGEHLPVAFVHGKNVATFLTEAGIDMSAQLQRWLPTQVWASVQRCSSFLIERRVYPGQPPEEK